MAAAAAEAVRQHGVKGAYVGGDWVDIEDCGTKFNIKNGSDKQSCKGDCATCPRSRSRQCAAKPDGTYDVIVIGAGCIGAAIARELSKKALSILWLEAADDVTQGATKGNSGIVHAGFDDVPNTNRSKYCWPGNQLFEQLDRELHFGYQKNGSLVIATSDEERKHLLELKARGEKNGVERLRIVEKEELFKLEPHINPRAVAALLSPDAGNLIPYEYAIALAENAVDNGVELRIRRHVKSISKPDESSPLFVVRAAYWEPRQYADSMGLTAVEESQGGSEAAEATTSPQQQLAVCFAVLASSLSLLQQQAANLATALGQSRQVVLGGGGLVCCLLTLALLVILRRSGTKRTGSASNVPLPPVGSGGKAVTVEEMKYGGSGSRSQVDGVTVAVEEYRASFIVNAAGSGSDVIAKMVGDDSFKIKPRLGDYLLLHRDQGSLAKHTLFPCPGPLGKGVLVQTTLWGNLILGPTARDQDHWTESADEVQRFILSKCRELVPAFDPKQVIHAFCGARAKSDRGDWIIEASRAHPKFIHAAGIDSPGLAGSPAIALEIVRLLQVAGLSMSQPNPTFNPNRAPIIVPKDGLKGGLKISIDPAQAATDPAKNVVCKCERTTEAEVLTALRRSLPIDSTQAIRKRTRAGMGHCQADASNYNCECRVAEIIARETGTPASVVGRRPWPATSTLSERWIGDAEKEKMQGLFRS